MYVPAAFVTSVLPRIFNSIVIVFSLILIKRYMQINLKWLYLYYIVLENDYAVFKKKFFVDVKEIYIQSQKNVQEKCLPRVCTNSQIFLLHC